MAPPPPQQVQTFAQQPQPTAQNSLYVELGGSSLFYSINYERFLQPDVAVRVGFSFISVSASAGTGMDMSSANVTWATVPIMAEYLGLHSGPHALELGAGLDMMYFSGKSSTFEATASASGVTPIPAANIGYSYSDPRGGFIFRAAYTPLFIVTGDQKQMVSWAGLSFGYRF